MKQTLAWGLAVALVLPAAAQESGLQGIASGKDAPPVLKLGELTPEWRRVRVTDNQPKDSSSNMLQQMMQMAMMSGKSEDAGEAAGAMVGMSLLGALLGGAQAKEETVYYTRGKTLTVGTETFLVAYRRPSAEPDIFKMALEAEGEEPPDFGKLAAIGTLTAESEVQLVLLNVRNIGTLADFTPFNLERELTEAAQGGGGGLRGLLAKMGEGMGISEGEEVFDAGPEVLQEIVTNTLRDDEHTRDPRNEIRVVVTDEHVILKGYAVSKFMRTRAAVLINETLRDLGDRRSVKNELTVRYLPPRR